MKVITVSNKVPTQPYYCWAAFNESLQRFGVTPLVLGMGEHWGGLMTKPRRLRDYLRSNYTGEVIIVCDAWDVVFARSPEDVAKEFYDERYEDTKILWNAEKNFFPFNPDLDFPETGTPYRYLNSGFSVGYDNAYLTLLESMDLDSIPDDHVDPAGQHVNPNDQEYFQQAFCKQPVPMMLDKDAIICQTLHAVEASELDLTNERIRNTVTGSYPMTFHMNGQKELWRDALLTKLDLPR